MNPNIDRLQPYPFQRLRLLLDGETPPSAVPHINLSIGEPKHRTPDFIRTALVEALDGLGVYPATQGSEPLRGAIAAWLRRRHGLRGLDPSTQVLPVTGSREALFSFAQAVVDPTRRQPVVVSPNPFYQIYEGAALLAGAQPHFLNMTATHGFAMDWSQIEPAVWERTQLLYVCSPGNPTGTVLSMEDWKAIFERADTYGFVIAADECYSELYFDEEAPPLGALQAAQALGRDDYARLVVFSSLSKRSSVPGLRSGFVAGDARILAQFLLYRTYHGCAMSPAVQAASIAAWSDEAHVKANRTLYRRKYEAVTPLLQAALDVDRPPAGFYLWARTPIPDTDFARQLYRDYNVTVLPGSFLAREAHGVNPGQDFVRIALVADEPSCIEAATRIAEFAGKIMGR
ncbi:MAG: succinyldiaminopimelate transaminase [Betaproteobacteria bacterium]|nr:succinyldiaminopimelate transaminase [Betaproteobacteria bacterium]